MGKCLNWKQILEEFNGEWIELVEYDWPEGTPFPKSGAIRVHSPDRKEFYKLARVDSPKDSAIVFVGPPKFPEGTVACSSLMKMTDAND